MVYSCGGFSRCFRIARFYDLEGPPVGVEYSKPGEDDRRALNPELQLEIRGEECMCECEDDG